MGISGGAVKSKSFALDPRQHPRYPPPRKTKSIFDIVYRKFVMSYNVSENKLIGGNMEKENNHLYPFLHIKKWVENHGKIYNKRAGKSHFVSRKKDFSSKFYYSLGEKNSVLEDRLEKIEGYISPLIAKIDEAEREIALSGKELELLKLYCVLAGSRHEFTCEVIKQDESGIYRSNQYLIGVHNANSQEEAVNVTTHIMDDFEKIIKMSNDMQSWIDSSPVDHKYLYSDYTVGLHLVIARAGQPIICVSDRFCIIENTMDSDFLYLYVPISPKTALLLVKSKYYFDELIYKETLCRFGKKYGNGEPDPYLSIIFDNCQDENYEDKLFCSYGKVRSCVHRNEFYFNRKIANMVKIKVDNFPDDIFRQFNSIYCEDGEKILYCNENELEFALNHKLACREIRL